MRYVLSILSFLAASVAIADVPASPQFDCFGTEPFWDLSISPSSIVFSEPLGSRVELRAVEPQKARGMVEDWVRVYRTQDSAGKAAQIVVRKNEECTDSMSEEKYGYEVVVSLDDVFYGCCNAVAAKQAK